MGTGKKLWMVRVSDSGADCKHSSLEDNYTKTFSEFNMLASYLINNVVSSSQLWKGCSMWNKLGERVDAMLYP